MNAHGTVRFETVKPLFSIIVIFTGLVLFLISPCNAEEAYEEDEPIIALTLPESFVYTGAAKYAVEIAIPPGRAGIQPKLSMNYNSYQRNGWLGVGWDLSLGSIRRSTKRHVGYTAYEFVEERNDGISELVSRPEWGSGFYGEKIEQEFVKYRFLGSAQGWEVTTKDGIKRYYGLSENSRQYDPADSSKVFRWCLERVEDTNGNYFTVSYTKSNGEIYIGQIDYTGNALTGEPGRYHILFEIEDRNDESLSYRSKFSVRTSKRLSSISVQFDSNLVARYDFAYEDGQETGQSRLQSIQRTGADGTTTLPATTFSWSDGGSGTFSGFPTFGIGPGISYDSNIISYMGDVNGDGLDDIFVQWRDVDHSDGGYSWIDDARVYLSNGNGSFQNKDAISLYSGNSLHEPASIEPIRLADVNGDGMDDMVMSFEDGGVRLATGSGNFGSTIENDLKLSTLSAGDINGDGRIDIAGNHEKSELSECELSVRIGLSNGNGTFQKVADIFIESGAGGGDVGCDMPEQREVHLADVSGDGYADLIIRDEDDQLQTYLSQGDGTFGSPSNLGISSWADAVGFGDFNGDGLSDLVVKSAGYDGLVDKVYRLIGSSSDSDSTQVTIYYSKGNGGYTAGTSRDLPFGSRSINVADVNGDGRADLIFGKKLGGICTLLAKSDGTFGTEIHSTSSDGGVITADINGDGLSDFLDYDSGDLKAFLADGSNRPDMLLGVNEWTGASTTIQYRPYSAFSYAPLPFMPNLVSSVTVNDGLGNLSETTYWYEGAHFDYRDRSFRGFQSVTQTNPDSTVIEHTFHQDDFRKGLKQSSVLGNDQGTALAETYWSWEAVPDSSAWGFVKLNSEDAIYYDNPTVSRRKDYAHDDTNGNLMSVLQSGTDGENVTTSYLYASFGEWLWRPTQETVTGSISGTVRESYFEYEDITGNLLAQEYWLDGGINPRIDYTYDTYGSRLTEKNARNHTTTTVYDATVHTYPITITNPKNHVRTYEYDYRFGLATAVIDANNQRTENDYDPFGRKIETRQPDGGRTTIQYFDSAAPRYVLTSVLESAGGETIDTYTFKDGLERKVETITHGYDQGPQAVVKQWLHDNMGRNYRVNGPFFGAGTRYAQTLPAEFPYIERTYDGRGRVLTESSPDSEHGIVTTSYAYAGFSTTITDPDAAQKIERKDYLGRIVEVNELAGNDEWYTTTYDYNAVGDLLNVVNHLGHTTAVTYDTLGRKKTMDDPDMGYWSYTYDPNGNMLTQTDAKNQTMEFSYDELDRVLTKTYSTSDPAVNYAYDLAINGIGRLTSISNTAVSKTIDAYDEMGRKTSVSKTFEGDATVYTTEHGYDLAGRLATLVYPDNYQVNYNYHPKTSLIHTVVGITDFTDYALVDTYEPTGKIGRLIHGNGVETHFTYDNESTRLTTIQTTDLNALALQDRAYRYTPAGDISQITLGDVTHVYTYDKLHRLISETTTGGEDSFAPEALDMSYNDLDHVHAVSDVIMNGDALIYEYDANGNMIQGPDFTDPGALATRIIDYNADNMPVRITTQLATGSIQTDFVYDGESRRAKKTTEGVTTLYVNENYEVIGGGATKYVFAGNLRVAEVSSSGVMHYHKDHLGSTMVMTDNDGVQKEQTEHLPFGGLRKAEGVTVFAYKFTDQELDQETGLYNYDARLYDPVIGRFIVADSIIPDYFKPQSFNKYSYVYNNPLVFIDPTGHDGMSACGRCHGDWEDNYGVDNSWGRTAAAATTGAIVGAAIGQKLGGGRLARIAGPVGGFLGGIHGYQTDVGLKGGGGLPADPIGDQNIPDPNPDISEDNLCDEPDYTRYDEADPPEGWEYESEDVSNETESSEDESDGNGASGDKSDDNSKKGDDE